MGHPQSHGWTCRGTFHLLGGSSDPVIQGVASQMPRARLHPLPISAGNSLSALLDGKATLTFLNRAEDYTLTMPYAHCKGERPCIPHPKGRARLAPSGRASGH